MAVQFVGGLYVPGRVKMNPPWTLLRATRTELTFEIRFGLQRWVGPWILERGAVSAVHLARRQGLTPWPVVRIAVDDGMPVDFRCYKAIDLLQSLTELGYPFTAERTP